MFRFKVIFAVFLIITLALFGCASDEEKKVDHFNKGLAYFEKGEFKNARLEFKNAIQIDPKYVDAYEKLGETNLKIGDARGAFSAYSAVAELEPDNTAVQLKIATFLMLAKKFEDSRKKLEMVLNREPTNVDALLMMAGLLGQEGDLTESEAAFKKVLEIDGKETRAYLGLAYLLPGKCK